MPTTTDDFTNPLLQAWGDVDRWLVDEARELARLDLALETTAYVLHGGVTTLAIRTPRLCPADADQIGIALAHMVHPMQPDQVLVIFPGAAGRPSVRAATTMHAMLGERGGAWRHVRVPVPYDDPRGTIVPTTDAAPDPWTAHVEAVFSDDAPPAPDVSKVRHVDEEFVVAVNPDGPAADLASRWPPTTAA